MSQLIYINETGRLTSFNVDFCFVHNFLPKLAHRVCKHASTEASSPPCMAVTKGLPQREHSLGPGKKPLRLSSLMMAPCLMHLLTFQSPWPLTRREATGFPELSWKTGSISSPKKLPWMAYWSSRVTCLVLNQRVSCTDWPRHVFPEPIPMIRGGVTLTGF